MVMFIVVFYIDDGVFIKFSVVYMLVEFVVVVVFDYWCIYMLMVDWVVYCGVQVYFFYIFFW